MLLIGVCFPSVAMTLRLSVLLSLLYPNPLLRSNIIPPLGEQEGGCSIRWFSSGLSRDLQVLDFRPTTFIHRHFLLQPHPNPPHRGREQKCSDQLFWLLNMVYSLLAIFFIVKNLNLNIPDSEILCPFGEIRRELYPFKLLFDGTLP